MTNICPICNRLFGGEMQDHHLKPKTFKSRDKTVHDNENKVTIHKICHQKLHSAIPESEMFHYYHTVPRLLEHEEIIKFVKWVSKKPSDFYSKNNETNSRKGKRKR